MVTWRRSVVGLFCAAALAAVGGSPAGADGPSGGRAAKGGSAATPSPLIDHGGKVLPASRTYAIWWGAAADFPVDAQTGIPQLLDGFGGSSYLAIATQYMRGPTASSSYGGSLFDSSAPPTHAPNVATIANEVAKLVTNPDPNAIYFVYTSNMPKLNYCAWHAAGTAAGVTFQVAYMPNTAGVAGCDPGNLYNANSLTEGTRSLADSTAHEFMEATTDPVPLSGWADKNGQEIGDKCNFMFGATNAQGADLVANGHPYIVQQEWSDTVHGCSMS